MAATVFVAGCQPDPIALCVEAHKTKWDDFARVKIDRRGAVVSDDARAGFETVRVPYHARTTSGAAVRDHAACEWWEGSDYVHIKRSERAAG